MTAQLIDGRKIAARLCEDVAAELHAAVTDGVPVALATISAGADSASQAYLRRIDRTAAVLGVSRQHKTLAGSATAADVVAAVRELNKDSAVSGILVLRPLPRGVDEATVFAALDPRKDVEAVHPENAGMLALGAPRYIPSTAAAVFHVLDSWLDATGQDPARFYRRARIVVVGRSNNVGKPAVSLAFAKQAAVTSVDEWASVDNQLGAYTRRADVLIVAAGVPELIRAEHVRAGAVVIDVGINVIESTPRIVGDVALDEIVDRARAVTPVPGGVGPVTDIWLMRNTVLAARNLRLAAERESRAS
ncbi:bifunctional 5,10-methylenetetrahydrofolate dehydrogenase/5,10-methenyltetrahydrofolate cyclohydrolase [Nocardia carnea]|uniref:bifunctional 5,10-methylenetetrahydrofolate dehydrogenase/5,10-methenyltetrahydrofolate cyclohydrolase n=1 Tax=Nocardia carnea TaxID=37328 RepID=UPI0024580778|nr:tetrahydrofolate dehydrogenase/cyclohydrolase catalytic domain-containing protein [Nocardia carnea]